MSGVHEALAALHKLDGLWAKEVACVEAEIARLEDNLDRERANHAALLRISQHAAEQWEARCARLLFIAENLFQMVPQSVWRDHGGDDMQGHYEGDYHAEKLCEELAGYREALAGLDTPADSQPAFGPDHPSYDEMGQ